LAELVLLLSESMERGEEREREGEEERERGEGREREGEKERERERERMKLLAPVRAHLLCWYCCYAKVWR